MTTLAHYISEHRHLGLAVDLGPRLGRNRLDGLYVLGEAPFEPADEDRILVALEQALGVRVCDARRVATGGPGLYLDARDLARVSGEFSDELADELSAEFEAAWENATSL